MGLSNYKRHYFSEAEYLDFEEHSETKHEYFDGEVLAMSCNNRNHNHLMSNTSVAFSNHLKNTRCEAFCIGLKVRTDDGNKYFYPDVLVTCEQTNGDAYFVHSPCLIVEVLSKSTREYDQNLKRSIYQKIPTLEEYVLIEQDHVEIEISRKSADWHSTYYFIDDEITFESIGLTLPVLEIYQRVDNQEMRDFLKILETNQQSKTS
jgi:Uma2 family endonuclease